MEYEGKLRSLLDTMSDDSADDGVVYVAPKYDAFGFVLKAARRDGVAPKHTAP